MKVLVTGATGLLGNYVVRQLVAQEHDVRVFVRSYPHSLKNIPVEIAFGDVLNPQEVCSAMEGCDAVVHAASITRQDHPSFRNYEEVNVKGTINVVNAAIQAGIKRFVYVSTANTIGAGTKEQPGTELAEFKLFRHNSGYINSKYLAQQYVLEQVAKYQFPAVIVNPTFLLGKYDCKPSSGRIILVGLKKLQLIPPGGKNFIYAEDAARGVVQALEKGIPGECYLLAGENLSYSQFFTLLNRVSGRKRIQIKIPAFLLYFVGYLTNLINLITGRSYLLNNSNAKLLCLDNYYTAQKAREEFGFSYVPIEIAIREAIEWFNANGYIRT